MLKGGSPHELIDALRAAARGEAYIHPALAGKLIQRFAQQSGSSDSGSRTDGLTEREMEVVRLVADGLTSREIAESLIISPNTVERHRSNIMSKLGMHNKAELVRYAVERGLLSDN